MKIQQLLDHHQINRNPFAEEDAQTDLIFKDYCIESTYHTSWDKVYGNPAEPATSVVFGEKGSGKTAMRLQMARHLEEYNQQHPDKRVFVIHYDDFNPFLDRFGEHFGGRRRADRLLKHWQLWDHMDAILTLGVTGLVDGILEVKQPNPTADGKIDADDIKSLDRHQARDLLLLAACYDQSTSETIRGRWRRLRRKLNFHIFLAGWDLALGVVWTAAVAGLVTTLIVKQQSDWLWPFWIYLLLAVVGWLPRLWKLWKNLWQAWSIVRHVRVGNHSTNGLCQILMNFTGAEMASQPLPNKDRTDDRYELLEKFQGILQSLGFDGIMVLVDRLDEPHLINGSAELMKALLWPMLDNKFLKYPGLGLKLMLPIELTRFVDREGRDFYQRARLDKQNMIKAFEWTGEALYDVANARIRACAVDGASPSLRDLFDPAVSDSRLIDAMRSLRVPRNLFKFMYQVFMAHCNACTEGKPQWTISAETFETQLAVYGRQQEAFERGLGAG